MARERVPGRQGLLRHLLPARPPRVPGRRGGRTLVPDLGAPRLRAGRLRAQGEGRCRLETGWAAPPAGRP
eukprot:2446231-Alexandrium_andersonii.AAC.1